MTILVSPEKKGLKVTKFWGKTCALKFETVRNTSFHKGNKKYIFSLKLLK